MTEYDVDFFISLIEERPVVWDTSNEDNKNKFIKQEAWKNVCKSLFPNFEEKENNEKTKLGRSLNEDQVIQLLGDGNLSDVDEFEDDDDDIQPCVLEDIFTEAEPEPQLLTALEPENIPGSSQPTSRPPSRKRVWKQVPFEDRSHDYAPLPVTPVKTPMEYFADYFDREFFDEIARCTNMYHHRKTGQELKLTSVEISRVFAIHIIIGCIPYPRIPMYWRGIGNWR
ncbi:unnamed protein product, partial [Brenthis ino]